LYMTTRWEVEFQNRLYIGPAIGFSIYEPDKEYNFSEVIIFLGLISLHIKCWHKI
jgi:hypothetical protein